MYQIRTDLALETQEKIKEENVELKGVRLTEEQVEPNIVISRVVIETENGAKSMGKPKGTYVTIEASDMSEEDDHYHREISVFLLYIAKVLAATACAFNASPCQLGDISEGSTPLT